MIKLSCPTKFHAFNLAEQLDKNQLLSTFYTSFASQKNTFLKIFTNRRDYEKIETNRIQTFPWRALRMKIYKDSFLQWNAFDHAVAKKIQKNNEFKVFIGWSGGSLHSMHVAKNQGKICILERGSTHIVHQQNLLINEYSHQGLGKFEMDRRIVEKEVKEYELADFIVVPSQFAKSSFVQYGIAPEKVVVMNFGASDYFLPNQSHSEERPFRVLFVGNLSLRKGIPYLTKALQNLNIEKNQYEAWFIGNKSDEINPWIMRSPTNWHFKGHINHYDLGKSINECDIAVLPSIEEGLAMVIPQCMKCGVPVIATENSGGTDIITNGHDGFIVPIRSSEKIADKINFLYSNPQILQKMKSNASFTAHTKLTWKNYGNRYVEFLNQHM